MKILVLSHNSFSKTHSNGKTLSSMFSAFGAEELCQLFFSPIGDLDLERCQYYYLIRDIDALYSIFKRSSCGSVISPSCSRKEIPSSLRRSTYPWILYYIRSLVWELTPWYKGGLNKWLEGQKPDLIFFVGGMALFSHRIALSLSRRLNIPLVSFFTDDYIIYPNRNPYSNSIIKQYGETINNSKGLYVIGEKMAEEYSAYFKRNFKHVMNLVNIPTTPPPYEPHADKLCINYFGGIGLGRDVELVRFAKYVRNNLTPLLHKSIQLGIYTFNVFPETIKKELIALDVILNNGLTGEELEFAMKETDIFLHVESIEPCYCKLTKLSVSTKIPEYMSLAKPIIAFGPISLASFDIIYQADSSLVITDSCSAKYENSQAIADVLNDNQKLLRIGNSNFKYAKEHFDKTYVSLKFRKEIEMIIHNRSKE